MKDTLRRSVLPGLMMETLFVRAIKGMTHVPSITRRLRKQGYRDREIRIILRLVDDRLNRLRSWQA